MVKLFRLGGLVWEDTLLIYHALANLNIEAIVLDSPREEYVCLGLHQKPDEELDLDYCRENNIGFFRREIGGGTVWLDNRQGVLEVIPPGGEGGGQVGVGAAEVDGRQGLDLVGNEPEIG